MVISMAFGMLRDVEVPAELIAAPVVTTAAPVLISATSIAAPVCNEDEPCWDWRTMGNQMAGYPRHGLNAPGVIVRSFEIGLRLAQ